ncbi:hypothetical protein Bhyg_16451 [Pseudolycoriella hygida]|uniref:Chitin-binding type-2 domain-containing protein n=1 Tax=Pseudolycoriella hygida TaxID=35572 RepID=A0A9Q0MKY7_9DIPT|nr:hypothetical protein Bhyg_16451 [Pseudolycoriella hygida]
MNWLLCCLILSSAAVAVSAECVEGTFAVHPNSCEKYLICTSAGVFEEMPCAPGTLFNAELNVCDWPCITNCANGTEITTTPPPVENVESCSCQVELAPLYHLEIPSNKHHFYTPSAEEAGRAVSQYGFVYRESPGLIAKNALDCQCRSSLKCPTRLYRIPTTSNPINDHFFTLDDADIFNYTQFYGYRWENWEAYRFYCSAVLGECGATVPLHRYLRSGKHYFSTTTVGHDDAKYEGVLCYIWP